MARTPEGAGSVVEVGEVDSGPLGGIGVREAVAPVTGGTLAVPVVLGAARGRDGRGGRARGRRSRPRPWGDGSSARWSRCAARAARDTRRRTPSVAGWPLLGTGGVASRAGLLVVGPAPAAVLALAGPGAVGVDRWPPAGRVTGARSRRASRIATAVADALAGGGSVRAALASAAASVEGPPAAELARVRADLELGASTAEALGGAPGSPAVATRVDSFATALLSQQLGGGDLAGLLRRFAASSAERDRVAADARSATAQARFTGLLVVAMPTGAALFAELVEPGFVGGARSSNPASAALLAARRLSSSGGFAAIRRLSAGSRTAMSVPGRGRR